MNRKSNTDKMRVAWLVQKVWEKSTSEEKEIYLGKLLDDTNMGELIDWFKKEKEIFALDHFEFGRIDGFNWTAEALEYKMKRLRTGKIEVCFTVYYDVEAIDEWNLSYYFGYAAGVREIMDRAERLQLGFLIERSSS